MTRSRPRPFALEALEDRLTPVTFGSGASYDGGFNGTAVAAGDLNGDGRDDVVLGAGAGGMISYLSSASGTLTSVDTVPVVDPRRVILVDVNGDTRLDFVVANGGGQQAVVALGNGDGTFQAQIGTPIGVNALDIAAADFDGDGKLDLVVARGGVTLLRGNGTATLFDPAVQIARGSDDEFITAGDFNGDGKPDIATGIYSGDAVHVLLNNGNGTFAAPASYSLTWHGGQIEAADLNGDGRDDVVVSYHGGAEFAVFLANPDGTLRPRVEYVPNPGAPGPGGLALADLDADGDIDLVVALPGSHRARAYTNDGNGTFGNPVTVSTGITPSALALGDFNGDGLPDLASSNATSPASVTVALNTTVVSLGSFAVSAPANATVGQPVTVTIAARTPGGSTFTGFTGTVQLTATDGLATFPATVTFTPADRGVKTITVVLKTVGNQTLTATATGGTGTSAPVAVATGSFAVTVPTAAIAGLPVSVTITALTGTGTPLPGYTGTVQLTSTDGLATFPATITFTPADAGVKTVTVTFRTSGPQALTATDAATGATGTSATVDVTTLALVVGTPAYAAAGLPVPVTVTARDEHGNPLTGFVGTVSLTSTDGRATFPAAITFTPADHGVKTVTVTFQTGGPQTVTAAYTATGATATSDPVVVAPTSFAVTAPAGATAGQPVTVTVTARDAGGATLTGFAGTVLLTSTDGLAILPVAVTFAPADQGVKIVTVTFNTPGAQTVTATYAAIGATGTSTPTAVALGSFAVSAPPEATTGEAVTVTVAARDAGGATLTGFAGTVQITSTDGQATFPATVTFTPADLGVKQITVTFRTVGAHRLTATDAALGATGTSGTVTVSAPAVTQVASTVTLTPLSGPTVFGDVAQFLVTVRQEPGLPVPTGTVSITRADTHEYIQNLFLDATGRAVLSTARLPAGTIPLAVAYYGDANYRPSEGEGVAQVDRQARVAVGSDAGPVTTVQVFDPRTGALLQTLFPFELYNGGAKVATGDVDNDGISDIIVSAGAGAPGGHVKVYSGANYAQIASFFTFPGYTGGVNVAAGDVDNDGFADVVVGTAVANDHVKALSGRALLSGASPDFSTLASFFAYGGGNPVGVTVAAGDVDGDGRADIVTGSATFAGHVKAFNAAGQLLGSYFAYGTGYLGGIFVAAGDVDGDGRAEIITGATNAPHVKVLTRNGAERASFFAYTNANGTPAPFGVRVGTVDRDRDRLADILTGPAAAAPHLKVFRGLDPAQLLDSLVATPPGQPYSPTGIFVAGTNR
ncbi:FG-GAP-like repeat-containing protein [Gemmata sp. JC717]|uniref:beta strand repeat-containing protein n=1 Tax=Gemmata algarum TaxID=2975278 RepID=UPI0021BB2CF4|nr:FG-GAP-like repeat-containing protein [Gemmata algarum]MDY3554722.1 FG-GAP-like repeat-containing protein [Gemmata algarum]